MRNLAAPFDGVTSHNASRGLTPINPNSVSVYEKRFLTTESDLREDSYEYLNDAEIRVDGTNLRRKRLGNGQTTQYFKVKVSLNEDTIEVRRDLLYMVPQRLWKERDAIPTSYRELKKQQIIKIKRAS